MTQQNRTGERGLNAKTPLVQEHPAGPSADENAVARLRASKERLDANRYAAGADAGNKYVLDQAEFGELDRLDDCVRSARFDPIQAIHNLRDLACVLCGPDDANGFIDALREDHGDDCFTTAWIKGFISGALKKFRELRPKI